MNRPVIAQLQTACNLVQTASGLVFFPGMVYLVFLVGKFQLVHFEASFQENSDHKMWTSVTALVGMVRSTEAGKISRRIQEMRL